MVNRSKHTKAVGTRERVIGWLLEHGDLIDEHGMASVVLARSVGYPGSSVAFAQLLSAMERCGLIRREVRGRRTYRVDLTDEGRTRASQPSARKKAEPAQRGTQLQTGVRLQQDRSQTVGSLGNHLSSADIDYDLLVHKLLVQIASQLTTESLFARSNHADPGSHDDIGPTVQALLDELAESRAARTALQAENDHLRQELERINLKLENVQRRVHPRAQRSALADDVDEDEIQLLQRLLSEHPLQRGRADRSA